MPSPVLERQVKVQSTPHTFLRRKKSPRPVLLVFAKTFSEGAALFVLSSAEILLVQSRGMDSLYSAKRTKEVLR